MVNFCEFLFTYIFEELSFINSNYVELFPIIFDFIQFSAGNCLSQLSKVIKMVRILLLKSVNVIFDKIEINQNKTYLSCVEILSFEYLSSALYLMLKHFLPEISNLWTRLKSSVLLPANIGPMINSILPLYYVYNFNKYLSSIFKGSLSFADDCLNSYCSNWALIMGLFGDYWSGSLFEQVYTSILNYMIYDMNLSVLIFQISKLALIIINILPTI